MALLNHLNSSDFVLLKNPALIINNMKVLSYDHLLETYALVLVLFDSILLVIIAFILLNGLNA